ncbi:Crp/Fnr family transcriptional regulator [Sphingobacterium griseoflavum]|uniref:Cyclic nucleotide-binding protein n=1 Tax=Sphingobacterium griseoflavum TaxID=1474952 RepID=A0ABQ3HRC6_9SPHI|nr:Crp/Fnr family transcriptional regulator [Sphingobacterium griseoflavum]GHE23830.1 cyclic nucleotide-binding protein [Sphingobacterium griseoflavum]
MEALAIIDRIAALPAANREQLASLFEELAFDKNSEIIVGGKRSRYLYFIKSGACRIFYHKEEREVILDFAFPGDALISLNSYVHERSGYETIQAMEPSLLYKVDARQLKQLFSLSIEIANWGRRLAEIETLKIEYRLMSKLFKTATESYTELLARAPNLVNTIKLGYIASYLGISQVTLSRIRAKI